MINELLLALKSDEEEVVRNSVVECGLWLETKGKGISDETVEILIETLVDLFHTVDPLTRSGIIWAIGKSPRSMGVADLRTILGEISETNDPNLIWQWLVSYENLVGSNALQMDLPIFERIALFATNDTRIAAALPRFNIMPRP